jgi:hypothetical protein
MEFRNCSLLCHEHGSMRRDEQYRAKFWPTHCIFTQVPCPARSLAIRSPNDYRYAQRFGWSAIAGRVKRNNLALPSSSGSTFQQALTVNQNAT